MHSFAGQDKSSAVLCIHPLSLSVHGSTAWLCVQKSCHECVYTLGVKHEQMLEKPKSVIWNKGRLRDAEPLSALHVRIGLDDVDSEDEVTNQPDFHTAAPSRAAKKVEYA
jgi:hypothetical protein